LNLQKTFTMNLRHFSSKNNTIVNSKPLTKFAKCPSTTKFLPVSDLHYSSMLLED
jgi:hypothetical protein